MFRRSLRRCERSECCSGDRRAWHLRGGRTVAICLEVERGLGSLADRPAGIVWPTKDVAFGEAVPGVDTRITPLCLGPPGSKERLSGYTP